MKLRKQSKSRTYSNYAMIIGIPVVVLAILFAFPQIGLPFTGSTFLIAIALIFLVCSRLGRQTMGGEGAAKQSLRKLIPRLLLAQLIIVIITMGFRLATLAFIPWNSDIPPQQMWLQTLPFDFFAYGIHPWGLILLIAVGMGVIGTKIQNKKPAGIFEPIFGSSTRLRFGAGFDGACVTSALFGIYILFSIVAMVLLSYISVIFHHRMIAPTLFWLFISLFMSIFMGRAWLRQWLIESSQSEANIGFLLIRVFGAFMLAAIVFMELMYLMPAGLQIGLAKNVMITSITALNLKEQWLVIGWAWPVLFVPLIARWVATEWQGYRVRTLAVAILALPLVIFLIYFSFKQMPVQNWIRHLDWLMSPTAITTISFFSCVILLWVLSVSHSLNEALVQMAPNIANTKVTRLKRLFTRSSTFIAAVMACFMMLGISSVFFMTEVFVFPLVCFWIFSLIAFFKFYLQLRRSETAEKAVIITEV